MAKIKNWGDIIIIIGIFIELCIWPSIPNVVGCMMTGICWVVFSRIGLDETVIKEHIFAWLVFLSMSLYRILPLFATLLEFHSIGYNFVVPVDTYCGETILYLFSALAFYLAINRKNNSLIWLKKTLFRCGFYTQVNNKMIWILGVAGLLIRIYLSSSNIEFGDIIGKTLSGFTFLQYAPIILFFPSLYNKYDSGKMIIYNRSALLYFSFLIILSFATNSRYAILEPFGTFVLLFFLSYINYPKSLRHNISKKYFVWAGISIIIIVPFISDVSLAMLATRGIRSKVDKIELFKETINTYLDRDKMEYLRRIKDLRDRKANDSDMTNLHNWSETYVSNFALNRYCNLKVTDNTLYHAEKVGFANKKMYTDFWSEIVALCPTPILNFIGFDYDKNKRYSRGDKLKALSTNTAPFGSYLITSHLADGLVTFGYIYFPIEFLLFFIRFLFLDTFLFKYDGRTFYSAFGLITIFSFLAMFRNAGGCCDSLSYLLREYWQNVILFTISLYILRNVATRP